MLARLGASIKVGTMLVMFFLPVAAAQWNRGLDQWLRSNHRLEGFSPDAVSITQTQTAVGSPSAK